MGVMTSGPATTAGTQDIYEERDSLTFKDGKGTSSRQPVVKEVPLTIYLNGEELAALVCSPHSLDLLAIGYLVSEGILREPDDLKDLSCRPDQGAVWVETADGAAQADGLIQRCVANSRGEGLSVLRSSDDDRQRLRVSQTARFTVRELLDLSALLEREAQTYRLTGGVHEAALAHKEGFVVSYEDIGRRNALDRVLGYAFLNGIDTSDKAVVLSARIASEMVVKAARIGVSVVVSRAAPTCLSIDLAEQLGVTIIGFARGNSLNVYSHPERVVV
jgi:FdhD protein